MKKSFVYLIMVAIVTVGIVIAFSAFSKKSNNTGPRVGSS